jgi:hypothetical protein
MRIITTDQRTPEWHAARLGCITASNAIRALTKPRKKGEEFSATQISYLDELVAEIMTGESYSFENQATLWGTENEEPALELYSARLTPMSYLERTGFIKPDDLDNVGVSLDAFSDDRNVEVKCPFKPANHVKHLRGDIDRAYILQMQFGMWVTDKELCDFVSYDPRMPPAHQLYVRGIERDPLVIEQLTETIPKLSAQLTKIVEDLLG